MSLKAYFDHVARPDVIFRHGEHGPEGLVKGKQAYFVAARGGDYSEGPRQAFNSQDTYLKAALEFIGIADIEVITYRAPHSVRGWQRRPSMRHSKEWMTCRMVHDNARFLHPFERIAGALQEQLIVSTTD